MLSDKSSKRFVTLESMWHSAKDKITGTENRSEVRKAGHGRKN